MYDRTAILAYINRKRHVTIHDLCENFEISDSTARRAVAQLEKLGKCSRFHGGAYALGHVGKTQVMTRQATNTTEKIKIAKAAASIIHDDATCIILSGSTVGYICRFIKEKPLTVITNSVLVFDELRVYSNIKLIILGGFYNHDEEELGGGIINTNLDYLRADYLFMGASSFDERSGFINRNLSVDVYRACLNACDTACMLVDSSKYAVGGTSIAARPEQIKYLFTDSNLDGKIIKHFQRKNIEVIVT
ncbi:MAG: DeoR/GlpR family DNA-binding transcription regulator [Planctomycetaceae bacterium]|nr:DeoR/GlpR family DNA-binding transcription regulator [Planctomycetaceae bacterium]